MAHTFSSATNGGTLEDCHTNIFVLTELNGLRWCRFSSNNVSQVCSEIRDDPILCAYGKCLQQSLLCVWRRVPPNNLPPCGSRVDLRLTSEKELWVFWYGEEPPWNQICNNSLTKDEGGGSWDKGVEYETRCLLFKALHNLIERCLLTRDFIRLGRWFVRPLELEEVSGDSARASHVMAFSFSFFIHGENNVCVSVNVQSQPAVYRLNKEYLDALSSSPVSSNGDSSNKRTVVLAPWSLKGVLNVDDLVKNDSEKQTRKREILLEWSNFYPFTSEADNAENLQNDTIDKERQPQIKNGCLPRVVEVTVGGVRLQYPACFVVLPSSVVENDNIQKYRNMSSRSCNNTLNSSFDSVRSSESPKFNSFKFQKRLVERTEEELTLSRKKSHPLSQTQSVATNSLTPDAGTSSTNGSPAPPVVALEETPMWNFVVTDSNNAQKDSCNCLNVTSQLVRTKAELKAGSRRNDRQIKLSKLSVFHRRAPTSFFNLQPSSTGNRLLPSLLSDFVTSVSASSSSGMFSQQMQSITVNTFSALPNSNGIEAISRPCSRSAANSSIQMISPAAAPPAAVSIDAKPRGYPATAENPSRVIETFQCSTSMNDKTLVETARTADGSDILVVKKPIVNFKRLHFSKRKPCDNNTRLLTSHTGVYGDETLNTQPLYRPDLFLYKDNCPFNEHQKKKFKMWTDFSSPVESSNVTNPFTIDKVEKFPSASNIRVQDETLPRDGVSPFQFESLTPETYVQQTFTNGINDLPGSYPSTAITDFGRFEKMPENIMEDDSSSNISGNDDESASNFLSPPPSHGQEDEGGSKKTKQNAQNLSTAVMPSSILNAHSKSAPATVGCPSATDFTIIYPTPPSVDNVQFSPESAVNPSWYEATRHPSTLDLLPTASSQHQHIVVAQSSSSAAASCRLDFDGGSKNKILERPITAKYVAGGKFGSLTSAKFAAYFTSNKRKLDEYRPKYNNGLASSMSPLLTSAPSSFAQSSFPLNSTAVVRGAQQTAANFNSGVQTLPPPPYSASRSASYTGNNYWSSPPSVRPLFAEQSPMMIATNSPMNSSGLLARTPRTPATADLQSPLSNASSQYGRNYGGSIDFNSVYSGSQSPEAHSLVLAMLLCETFVDLHKDVIFDSCPICVCSTNIQGSEMGLYVPSAAPFCDPHSLSYQNSKCLCGFSASRHRYLSYRSGLFYEDEYESSGVWRCRTPPIMFTPEVVELIRYQSLTVDLSRSVSGNQSFFYRCDRVTGSSGVWNGYNSSDLELNDFAELCNIAMEQACMFSDCTVPTREDMRTRSSLVYSWGFLKSLHPVGNGEAMSLIRSLLPVLQESVQKPRGNWNAKYKVEGPLTWRQFHRKCSSVRFGVDGKDDVSGPEPVPLLLASADREWVTTSPFALKLGDRLSLETYGQPKDVVYIVVAPDNQLILPKCETFFRELSKVYEGLRFGKHCPWTEILENGFFKVSKSRVSSVQNKPVDAWFDQCTSSSSKDTVGCRLKAYAQICRHVVAPTLNSSNIFERSALQKLRKDSQATTPSLSNDSAMPPPPVPQISASSHDMSDSSAALDSGASDAFDADNSPLPHVVVVYLVNCFTYGPETEDEDHNRLVTMGLFRSYLEIFKELPDNIKGSLQLQVVPLQTILDFSLPSDNSSVNSGCIFDIPLASRSSLSQSEYFRELALNVFSQSRNAGLRCILSLQGKQLTGFGPAASRIDIIKRKLERSPNALFEIHCPQVILAPTFEHSPLNANSAGLITSVSCESRDDTVRVLFLTYCLSEKQRWLLAAATDHQGALLENCVINMNIQDRWSAARCAVIRSALNKLVTFAYSLMATSCQPWRLIVGRLGRIGHEELKEWTRLLSKTNLRSRSRQLRENCVACTSMTDHRLRDNFIYDTPTLLSACLIATEVDSSFRLFSDSFSYDERFGQNAKQCPLSTPEDVSCTHIMVFPTSASIQMNQPGASSNGQGNEEELESIFDDFLKDDIVDPDILHDENIMIPNRPNETGDDIIQQQPLALGYSVSTAPVDFSCDWFWSNCPSAKHVMPAYLRSSLHINTNGILQNDEQLFLPTAKSRDTTHGHPLDSSVTTDVLRYALETYNALSWLNLDPTTGDRKSCLPIHMQALGRLYKAVEDFL